MTIGDDAQRRFEQHVLVEFERVLFEYCQLAIVHPRVDPAGLRVRITVVSGPPVETIRDRVWELARQTVRHELDGAELLGVTFARDVSNQDHGCRILIQPPLPDAETDQEQRRVAPEVPSVWDAPTVPVGGRLSAEPRHQPWAGSELLVLTLGYEDRLRWSYPLLPGESWIPLGRGLVSAGTRSTIRVPDFVTAVPRGPLLMLRFLPGVVTLLRSVERPGYTVTVDGQPVRPGGTAAVRDAGSIHYAHGQHATAPGSGPSAAPPAPYTTLTYRFERGL